MNITRIKAVQKRLESTVQTRINKDKEQIAKAIQKKIQPKIDRLHKLNTEKEKIEDEITQYLRTTEGSMAFYGYRDASNVSIKHTYRHPKEQELNKAVKDFIFELTIDNTNALKKIEEFVQKLNKI